MGAALVAVAAVRALPSPGGVFGVTSRTYAIAESETGGFDATIWMPVSAPEPMPLLISMASWGGVRAENLSLARDLASRGFVVVALDDVVHDTRPRPELLGALDLSSDAAFVRTRELARRKRAAEGRRISSVIDRVLGGHAPIGSDLRTRIDARHIAAYGYSFGGAAAYAAAQSDARIRAVMNIDGWLFAGKTHAVVSPFPYLFVGTEEPAPTEADLHARDPERRIRALLDREDWRDQMQRLEGGGAAVLVAGTQHGDFADGSGFLHRVRQAIRPARLLAIVGGSAALFFQRALSSDSRILLDAHDVRDPAVRVESWPCAAQAGKR